METNLKKLLLKAKIKHIILVIGIALISFIVGSIIIYKTSNYFVAKQSDQLNEQLRLHNEVAEPNVRIDYQTLYNNSSFGGEVMVSRSKEINGYLVPWSTLYNSYSLREYQIDWNNLVPSGYNNYTYDRQTNQKIATFYNPSNKHYNGIENELQNIVLLNDHVAEVAISFDKPYKVSEIEKMIPSSLNVAWLYVFSEKINEDDEYASEEMFGFSLDDAEIKHINEDTYNNFMQSLKKYAGDQKCIKEYITKNKKKSVKDLEVYGVMLTGQTKNFSSLVGKPFIRGASIGATAKIVPYIQPKK